MPRLLACTLLVVIGLAAVDGHAAPALPGPAELKAEVTEKLGRVQRFLSEQKLGGLLLTQIRNIAWVTAGQAPNPIVMTSEVAPYSLLLLRNGKRYLLANNMEAQRAQDEELRGLGYVTRLSPWHKDGLPAALRELAGGQAIGSDLPMPEVRAVDVMPLRVPLTASELKKYRWLGRQSTEAVIEVIEKLRPGMTEKQIGALTSDALLRREIQPTVILIGTEPRLFKYRHLPPAAGKLVKYGMVNICARRWGLVIAVTRFVHFGKLTAALEKRLQATARMNAEFLAASRPGAVAGAILERAQAQYAKLGFPGQWEKHHQGGAIGYGERDWTARPGGTEKLQAGQTVAWNPTIEGAKVEDTVLITRDGLENLTETPGWPTITHTVDGREIRSPAILVK